MHSAADAAAAPVRARLLGYVALLALAAFIYFFGLGGQNIPTNGDEYVYAHITRLTAASGRLLPLQSHLDGIRNTKPPLLFWQGIAATDRGRDWRLENLRYPSVIYTLLTALLILALARRLSGDTATGIKAALVFLAFFSTYRYGRPFLTDPALIFWLGLPFFTLLFWRPGSFESRIAVPLLIGIELGVGLLYKSFALVVPVCAALGWWYLHHREYRLKVFLVRDSWKIAVSGCCALLLFSMWLVLDPDPSSVWKEFVVGENIGKFEPHGSSYLRGLLWGGYSIWSFALAFFANAGLLIFPAGGLCALAISRRSGMSLDKTLLWLWIISFFLLFSLPSQRSGRYLMPVMPALAVLLALEWDRLSRWLFAATLVGAGVLFAVAFHLALILNAQAEAPLYGPAYWLLLAAACALLVTGLVVPATTRALGVTAALLVYLVFTSFMRPLDGRLGTYSPHVIESLQGREVWVPCNFRAREEGGFFLLPGAVVHGYRESPGLAAGELAGRYPLFAVQVPVAADRAAVLAAAGEECRIVGERLDLRSRHSGSEIGRMLFGGQLFELLFVRVLLIESLRAPADAGARWAAAECR